MLDPLPDLGLIATEEVVLVRPSASLDDLGEPTYGEPERTAVPGCIVQPGATGGLGAERPNGVEIAFTVYMPWPGEPIRGCSMEIRGERYAVVGDPRPSTAANVPGGRNLAVEAAMADG